MRNPVNRTNRFRAVVTVATIVAIALIAVQSKPTTESDTKKYYILKDFVIPAAPVQPIPTPKLNQAIKDHKDLQKIINGIEISYIAVNIEYEYIGTYFITAYCPSECGWNGDPDNLNGWHTASGEICHRAGYEDRLYEPTTCAVDRNYHSFGDLLYVEGFDRVFVAEDTGSAVKGRHLDLFYEEYDDVITFPTGYYAVYSVEYVTVIKTAKEKHYDINYYLYDCDWCYRSDCRYDFGKPD